ncbi:MAG TPA: efflux RND transporter permease subunit [Candidatus Limnocylindria bacterium]|nr:efflux RND transporter permease subunit [Candidatus Limnocylindria bacterium]
MNLPRLCIERPVLAVVLSLVIMLVGTISAFRLPNREYPDVDPPIVGVSTALPGAAPEVIETSVTAPLEDQLIGIEGVRHVMSTSLEQVSQITVEFDVSRDLDAAANDVRDRVARVLRDLPEEAEAPIVAKQDADAAPIMWLALFGGNLDQIALSTLAETRVKDRLAKLPGVSDVYLNGEKRHSIRVWLDNGRLTAHNLTVADVAAALSRENVDLPSGRVEGLDSEFTVRTLGELTTPEEYQRLIVAYTAGAPVRLGDVARIEVGPEDERKIVRFNGQPAVGLGIIKQSKANTLDVALAVKAEVPRIRETLPPGVELAQGYDSSIFIERSLADVRETIAEAIVLVVIVIYLFLRSLRATIVPALAIPVSVVGTFAVLDLLGFSINTLTLLGLTLAVGDIVDDAIVVLENVVRWIEAGTPRMEAARRGMDQIVFAVVASTISIMAVFVPLVFLTDTTGRMFREFGVTVAVAVGISGFVALTLSPMLCSRILRPHRPDHGLKRVLALALDRLTSGYARLLGTALAHRRVLLAAGALWVLLGVWLLGRVPREFIPPDDRGSVRTFYRAPEGSTLEYMDRYMRQAEAIVLDTPEVAKTFSVLPLGRGRPGQVTEGGMFATLVPWEERARSQQTIVDELRHRLADVPGIQAFPQNPSAIGQRFSAAPITLVIQGPNVQTLARIADEVVGRGRDVPGVVNLQTDLLLTKPQLDVRIDRDRAADLGVSVREIATTLQILLGGVDLSTFKLEGETYDVIARLDRPARSSASDLRGIYVHGRDGQLISLDAVVDARETVTARGLPHHDRQRAATVTGALAQGVPLGTALASMTALAEQAAAAAGPEYRVTYGGETEDYLVSGRSLFFAYLLAVVIVYLVLAAQFDSLLHPLTVMVAVALSFTGGLVTLLAAGMTLNLYSEIGLVMLVGLVTKNSILIVEFANQLRNEGRSLLQATLEASQARFRPILMTAASTVVGLLPIVLGTGTGGEARAPLGVAVAGGMFFSTVLTFFVVPCVHVALGTLGVRLRETVRVGRSASPAIDPGQPPY